VSETATADLAAQPRRWRVKRLIVGALVIIVVGAAADLLGWNIRDWFKDLWNTITEISVGYLIAAIALKTLQTTATAFAWYSILRYAYPSRVAWREVLACYAASVALNSFLPANLGTLMLLVMLPTVIAGATFAGVVTAFGVEKIFFTLAGMFVYVYLFLSVDGSFDLRFDWVHERPWLTGIIVVGIVVFLWLLAQEFRPRVQALRSTAARSSCTRAPTSAACSCRRW
jgi:uncharacterized membrane protein YbhN (UPF0104 family)